MAVTHVNGASAGVNGLVSPEAPSSDLKLGTAAQALRGRAAFGLSNFYLVVRHLTAFSNLNKVLIASPDYEPDRLRLPESSLTQGQILGFRIAHILSRCELPITIDQIDIRVSPLPRATHSIDIIRHIVATEWGGFRGKLPEAKVEPRLVERRWGANFEGREASAWSEVRDADLRGETLEGVEPQIDLLERSANLLLECEQRSGRLCIFLTHADTAQALRAVADPAHFACNHYSEVPELGNGEVAELPRHRLRSWGLSFQQN